MQEAKTGEDDARMRQKENPKKLPDGVWEGGGGAEEPQEEPGLHLGREVQARGACELGAWVGSGEDTEDSGLGIFRMSVSQRWVGLYARQKTWAWLRREAGTGDWWGREWLGPRLEEDSQ